MHPRLSTGPLRHLHRLPAYRDRDRRLGRGGRGHASRHPRGLCPASDHARLRPHPRPRETATRRWVECQHEPQPAVASASRGLRHSRNSRASMRSGNTDPLQKHAGHPLRSRHPVRPEQGAQIRHRAPPVRGCGSGAMANDHPAIAGCSCVLATLSCRRLEGSRLSPGVEHRPAGSRDQRFEQRNLPGKVRATAVGQAVSP